MAATNDFPPPRSTPRGNPREDPGSGLCIAKQNRWSAPSFAALRPYRFASGADPARPPAFLAMKAAMIAVKPRNHPMSEHDDFEPEHKNRASITTIYSLTSLRALRHHICVYISMSIMCIYTRITFV